MEKYSLKKIDTDDIKYFSIQLGLMPGYDKKPEYPLSKVQELYQNYLQKKLNKKLFVFPVKITPCSFVYGFQSNDKTICNTESAVEIQGEIMREHHQHIFEDNEILLKEIVHIAHYLGDHIQQKRVHIQFQNKKYILEL